MQSYIAQSTLTEFFCQKVLEDHANDLYQKSDYFAVSQLNQMQTNFHQNFIRSFQNITQATP